MGKMFFNILAAFAEFEVDRPTTEVKISKVSG